MEHESRLMGEMRRLFSVSRRAALATTDSEGHPYASAVPYAVDPQSARVVLLISGLAAHTEHIRRQPRVSLLVAEPERAGEPVHALGRLTLTAHAEVLEPGDAGIEALGLAYLRRFPDAEPIACLPDFRYVALRVLAVRQVAGFGAARDVALAELERLLRSL